MKLYVVSGLGADYSVLSKIQFNSGMQIEFLNWLIPEHQESFEQYVQRFVDRIDDSEPFCLLGYSFGGLIVQEIHQRKKAEKVIILGSIRSDQEKSRFIRFGEKTKIPRYLPTGLFNEKSSIAYAFLRKLFDPKNPKLNQYFVMKDPYYLKWSVEKISEWKFKEIPNVIQIHGDKDIVFPIKNSRPDYIIKGGTHLFPVTKSKEVTQILNSILKEYQS